MKRGFDLRKGLAENRVRHEVALIRERHRLVQLIARPTGCRWVTTAMNQSSHLFMRESIAPLAPPPDTDSEDRLSLVCLSVFIFFCRASTFFCMSTKEVPIWVTESLSPKSPSAEATCNDTPPNTNPSKNAGIANRDSDRPV